MEHISYYFQIVKEFRFTKSWSHLARLMSLAKLLKAVDRFLEGTLQYTVKFFFF